MTNQTVSQKLPSLDGWRAVSIVLVLLAHSSHTVGFPARFHAVSDVFDVGVLGVQFFFVISGFLITWLLLQEKEKNGRINLKFFYVRRAVRILPVCFLYLLVLAWFTNYSQSPVAWLVNLTFTSDFYSTPWPTSHLWSLGVEEQFYLLWPLLLVLCLGRPGGGAWLLKILIIPLIVAPVVRLLGCKLWYPEAFQFLFQSRSFFCSFDSLAYGCLAAILLHERRTVLEFIFQKNYRLIMWGGLTLVLIPLALKISNVPQRIKATGFDSLQATGFSLLLLQSILYPSRGWYRLLNCKWMVHLGVLSYSTYIWQQMFCLTDASIFGMKDGWWASFPVWILMALLAAHASYYLMEKPLLGLRARFRKL